MERDSDIENIRRRWASAHSILKWHGIPPERRQRVLAELEENARTVATDDPQLASDLTCAVDGLDCWDHAALLDLLKQAHADISALLQRPLR